MKRVVPLLETVLGYKSDETIWDAAYIAVTETTPLPHPPPDPQTPTKQKSGSVVNSSEFRQQMDLILKDELEHMYVDVPGFYETFFGGVEGLESAAQAAFEMCKKEGKGKKGKKGKRGKKGNKPLYSEENGWLKWPKKAEEDEVLEWLEELSRQLTDFANQCQFVTKAHRRPLALPNKPLALSTAKRKLDVGFVDHPGADEECDWSHILVSGELKRNPDADTPSTSWLDLATHVREVFANQDTRRFALGFTLCGSFMRLWEFDRAGMFGSEKFDINKDGLRLVKIILGFLSMNEEQLGFDPTITTAGGKRFIQIERNGQQERFIIEELLTRAGCIVGRGTTCWKAHLEGDDSGTPFVIKDSWQYPQRPEEGEMTREATVKKVVNVARYYYHETVSVGNQDDDVESNVRKSLDVPKGKMKKLDAFMKRGKNSTTITITTGKKRSLNNADDFAPSSKRTRISTTPPITLQNRVHRRLIVCDYGKPIYKASSRTALLAAFEGCIEGHKSLHDNAGILQRDISMNNLMMNEEKGNPSWKSFLIDLDLAIKVQRLGSSGAREKTGTRAFMAIGVLFGEKHLFMHDCESFFWVLFWICIHYDGPDNARVVPRFEKWNYEVMAELAERKIALATDESHFLTTALENFTPFYQPLVFWVNRLRRAVFPGNQRWTKPDPSLYSHMIMILREAQGDLKVRGEDS